MRVWVLNPPYFKRFSRPQRSPAVTKSGTVYFPIWLASCTGVLEEAGFDVVFTDAPAADIDLVRVTETAAQMQPPLVVVDTSTPSINSDMSVCREMKKVSPASFIVMVGTHVSAVPGETLTRCDAVDAVARKEYEYTIRELAEVINTEPADMKKALLQVNGLSFRAGGKIHHNPDRPFLENLDALPWVSRVYHRHLNIKDYFNPNALFPMVTLMTSRGCPFQCSFCVYPQTLTGRRFRFRSVGDVVEELKYIKQTFPGAKSVFFEDDTLSANRKRCAAFANALMESSLDINWTTNSRIDPDLETLMRLKKAGCRTLCVGFESGNQGILNSMHKGIKREKMFRFMADARKAGILIHGCFMVGFMDETREQIEETVKLAIELNPDTVQFYPVMVYPGTSAYEAYREKGWITVDSYDEWLTPEGLHNCVVRNAEMSSAELVRICDTARRRFYLRPNYILRKLWQMAGSYAEARRTVKAFRTFYKHLLFGSLR